MAQYGTLTDVGKAYLLTALLDNSYSALYLGWGLGAGNSSPTDTTLFTEDNGGSPAYARALATVSLITTNTTNDTLQVSGTLVSNGTKSITNAGIFNNPTGGILVFHSDFPPTGVENGNTLTFTYNWTL